jgi:hypothetical protein
MSRVARTRKVLGGTSCEIRSAHQCCQCKPVRLGHGATEDAMHSKAISIIKGGSIQATRTIIKEQDRIGSSSIKGSKSVEKSIKRSTTSNWSNCQASSEQRLSQQKHLGKQQNNQTTKRAARQSASSKGAASKRPKNNCEESS